MGMNQHEDSKEIQMKCCPRCKTIILSSNRYGNIIKQNFQDIVKVKNKILAASGDPRQFAENLQAKMNLILQLNVQLTEELHHKISYDLAKGIQAIQNSLTPRKGKDKLIFPTLHSDQRFLYEVQIDVSERILDVMRNTSKVLPPSARSSQRFFQQLLGKMSVSVQMKPEFMLDILDRLQRLFHSLFNRERFCEKEHQSFIAEIERLDMVRAYFMLKSAPTYRGNAPRLAKERNELRGLLINNVKKLTEQEKIVVKTALQTMGKILNTGLGISDEERQQIIKAVGLKLGHW